ncbi:MAG TPA: MBL fold metallo-hydrolase [Candidatus Paceibacterota bacterium]
MVITYLGAEFFKVQYGDTTIAYNPVSKESKLKSARFGADIALVALNHRDMTGAGQVEFGGKKPFVISGPGEYEIKGIFTKGYKSLSHYDGEERYNTIYVLNLENMNLCFLGALSKDLDSETKEALDDIDILFLPIGGKGVLTPAEANKLAVSLEPKLVIPMHYGDIGEQNALKTFLKEAGENPKPIDKLTIKKKDLEGKEGEVVVLEPAGA